MMLISAMISKMPFFERHSKQPERLKSCKYARYLITIKGGLHNSRGRDLGIFSIFVKKKLIIPFGEVLRTSS